MGASGETFEESYAGVYDGRLEAGDCLALLVVDLVVAYSDETSPLYCDTAAAAIAVNRRLIDAAREADVPVVFTNVAYGPGDKAGNVFYRKAPVLRVFDEGSPLGAFPDGIEPASIETVTKQYPSAFFGTDVAERLRARGVDTLLITGFSTSGCVRASALDALQEGFIPFVVRDACADRHPEPHEANLRDLQAKYAEVIDSTAALKLLGR